MSSYYKYEQKLIDKLEFSQRISLADSVYLALKDLIVDGTFPLGERINENSLSTQLNISRTPIRKALNRLKEESLVDHVPEFGFFVKSVNTDKIREIYKIRKSLEVLLYEEVEKNCTEEQLISLKDSTERMITFEDTNQTENLNMELNNFNNIINEVAKMATLTNVLEDLNTYFKNFRNFSFNTRSRRKLATREHRSMVLFIESHEPEFLKKTVDKHIENAEIAAIKFFNSKSFTPESLNNFYQKKEPNVFCSPDCPIKIDPFTI